MKGFKVVVSGLLVFLVLGVSGSARAQIQEVVIPALKDNTLYQDQSGSLSNGAGIHFFAGQTRLGLLRRAVIEFSLEGAVPPGATIDSVLLSLTVSKWAETTSREVFLHGLDADWGEGSSNAGDSQDGDGVASQTGDATWIHRSFSSETWSTEGGDYSADVSARAMVGGPGAYSWGGSGSDRIVQDVQGWLDSPGSNYGWILIGGEGVNLSARRYNSRESSSGAPQLTIRYSATTTDVISGTSEVPGEFRLNQNYPNPFNPATTIGFSLPEAAFVRLTVHNILGEEVATLVARNYPAGVFNASWDAAGFPSGAYFYR
ncbi:MAG: DNRLRE domain-containing protein, partial [Bacteroidota bacterium]